MLKLITVDICLWECVCVFVSVCMHACVCVCACASVHVCVFVCLIQPHCLGVVGEVTDVKMAG